MEEYKTLYNWCSLNNARPLDINLTEETDEGDDFMLKEISLTEFKAFLKSGNYKENSMPRKPRKFLELRMYGLVPYNISKIQQGIQFNHANDLYSLNYPDDEDYFWFRKEWKTNIILNGGTSNEGTLVSHGFKTVEYIGTMQEHLADLKSNNVKVSTFYEPDLNSMLSAICFLVDERVFNKDSYPDFEPPSLMADSTIAELNKWSKDNDSQYANWVSKIGGPRNEFLRKFLADKRLA